MKYLAEFNEKQRRERALRAAEKQNRIKQRVQAAAEMELRRKITMVRQWRANERKRLNRLKQEREEKQKKQEDEVGLFVNISRSLCRWPMQLKIVLISKYTKEELKRCYKLLIFIFKI